jgi:flagellar biosynthesis/type III secretory pathway protein FliH
MKPKPKKTGYVTLNVKPDTLDSVRRYAGKLQAKRGGRITEDAAVKALLKNRTEPASLQRSNF